MDSESRNLQQSKTPRVVESFTKKSQRLTNPSPSPSYWSGKSMSTAPISWQLRHASHSSPITPISTYTHRTLTVHKSIETILNLGYSWNLMDIHSKVAHKLQEWRLTASPDNFTRCPGWRRPGRVKAQWFEPNDLRPLEMLERYVRMKGWIMLDPRLLAVIFWPRSSPQTHKLMLQSLTPKHAIKLFQSLAACKHQPTKIRSW